MRTSAADQMTLCRLPVAPFRPGRKRPPTCSGCVAAAAVLPAWQRPDFWAPATVEPDRPAAGERGDPPVRADGRCAQCGKPRKLTKQARRYAGYQLDADPFCSTHCCRAYHGTPLPGGSIWRRYDEEAVAV